MVIRIIWKLIESGMKVNVVDFIVSRIINTMWFIAFLGLKQKIIYKLHIVRK